jgi:predicted CopG family antitoxin
MAGDVTTITIPSEVLRRLKLYKTGGRTYSEVLEEFMDAVPPKTFLEWAERELQKPAVPYLEFRKAASTKSH